MDATDTHSQEERIPQSTQTRKRQIGSDDDDHEPKPKRVRLTRKNLALLDKMGRKPKKSLDATDDSATTKSISTTTSGFALQAFKNGVRQPPYAEQPTNFKDLCERYARPRETASPPESEYQRYTTRVKKIKNEATMVVETSRLLKNYEEDDNEYSRSFNQSFSALPEDVGFNQGLSAPQPDFTEGLEMQTYTPFLVDEHVSGAALYKDDPHSVTLSHIAGEWKGPDGSMKTAQMQAAYDGAALTYGRNQALAYMRKSEAPGHAKVTTFTTDGSQLNFYSHHTTETDDSKLEYHQYPLTTISLTGSFEGYKEGYRHIRNTQDEARETSYQLRDDLQSHWQATKYPPDPLPTITDDEAAYEFVEPPSTYSYEATDHPPAPTTSKPPKKDRTTSSHSYNTRSSKVPQSTHNHTSSSSHQKTSSSYTSSHKSSGHSSKPKNYWKKDSQTGAYYHKHSDGTISWRDDEEW